MMSSTMNTLNRKQIQQVSKKLDRDMLDKNHMPWLFRRFYPRGDRNSYSLKEMIKGLFLIAGSTFVGLFLLGRVPFVGEFILFFLGYPLYKLLNDGAKNPLASLLFLGVSGFFWWKNIDMGFSFFKWHYDIYIYSTFFVFSLLSFLFHLWNGWIWRYLDRCVVEAYQKHGLDVTLSYDAIVDYKTAYHNTRERLEKVITQLPNLAEKINAHSQITRANTDKALWGCQNTLDTYLSIIDEVTHAN